MSNYFTITILTLWKKQLCYNFRKYFRSNPTKIRKCIRLDRDYMVHAWKKHRKPRHNINILFNFQIWYDIAIIKAPINSFCAKYIISFLPLSFQSIFMCFKERQILFKRAMWGYIWGEVMCWVLVWLLNAIYNF